MAEVDPPKRKRGNPAWQKGMPRHPDSGRKEGTPNAVPVTVKGVFLKVFEGLQDPDPRLPDGQVDKKRLAARLDQWAVANPTEFYKLASKLIPTEIKPLGGAPGAGMPVIMIGFGPGDDEDPSELPAPDEPGRVVSEQ